MKSLSRIMLPLVILGSPVLGQEAYPERLQTTQVATSQIVRLKLNSTSKTLLVSSVDNPLRILDAGTLADKGQFPAQENIRPTSFSTSLSGHRLAVGYNDGTVKVFTMQGMVPGASFSAHKGSVISLSVPDENLSYSIGADREVSICDILSGNELGALSFAPQEPTDVLTHPDGRQFAVALASGQVQFYNLAGLKPGISLSASTGRLTSLQFSPDGSVLAVGLADGTLKTFTTADGKEGVSLKLHGLPVTGIAFSPSRNWLVSVASDSTMAIIDLASMKAASTIRAEGAAWTQAVFAADDMLIASTASGAIERWEIKKTPPDVDPPAIVVETPVSRPAGLPYRLYAREIDLTFVVWDNLKLGTTTVNGRPIQLSPLGSSDTVRVPAGAASGKTTMRLKLDTVGRNTVSIVATDALGLSTSRSLVVERLSSSDALEILAPDGKEEVEMVNIPIQFRAWFAVKTFSVTINLIGIIRDKQLRGKLPGDVITEEIPLVAGYNQIQLDITGTKGEKISRTLGVTRKYTAAVAQATKPAAAKRSPASGPQKWAVVVGVSQYSNPGIPSLKYADKDAEAFANFLRTPEGGGYDNEHMRVLLNESATFGSLRDALMDFLSNAIDIDLVMIYFAGHGAPDPARPQNLYLLTHDTDPNKLSTTAFPMWQIQDVLARYISAKKIVVFSDACHSGGISVNFATRGVGVTEQNLVNQYLADLSRSKDGTIVFTASAAGEVSQEFPEFNHGVFTYYMLEGLRGKADYNNDYTITINEAMQYTEENVKRKTRGAQNPTRSQTDYDKELTVALIQH